MPGILINGSRFSLKEFSNPAGVGKTVLQTAIILDEWPILQIKSLKVKQKCSRRFQDIFALGYKKSDHIAMIAILNLLIKSCYIPVVF